LRKSISKKAEQILQTLADRPVFYPLMMIAVVGLIAYSNSFFCSFHFDDFRDISDNKAIRIFWDVKTWWTFYPTRAVAMGTFALNYLIAKNSLVGYHIVNLLIHIMNGMLVYWLIQQTLRTHRFRDQFRKEQIISVALLGALLFTAHPIQTQAVTYIVQRMASLATLFYLLTLNSYIHARTKDGLNITWMLIAGISTILGMYTKQIVFTLPIVAVIYDLYFINQQPLKQLLLQKKTIFYIAGLLILLSIIPFLESYTFSVLFRKIVPQQGNGYYITGAEYLFTQFRVVITYIRLLFLPIQQNLDYDYPISQSFFELPTFVSFIVLISLFTLAIFIRRKHSLISFSILWFFITLSIESSIIPLPNVIFEHRLYLPSVGSIFLVTGILFVYRKIINSLPYLACAGILVIVLTTMTFQRNKVWKSDLTLWTDNLAKSPNKARVHYNMGRAYYVNGQYELSNKHFEKSLVFNHLMYEAYSNMAANYIRYDDLETGLNLVNKALAIKPLYTDALNNRANIYIQRKEYENALVDLETALSKDSTYALAYQNRGDIFRDQGNVNQAITEYSKAIRHNPKLAKAFLRRGLQYLKMNDYSLAVKDFTDASALEPELAEAHYNKGLSYYRLTQYDDAIRAFSEAIREDSTHRKAYYNRSLTYAYHKKQYVNAWNDLQQAKSQGYQIDKTYYDALAEYFQKPIRP